MNIDPETGEILPVFIRTPYNYDTDAASLAAGHRNDEPSMTKQSFAEEADINTIVRKFGLTGELPPNGVRMPDYGDFTDAVNDYQTALNAVIAADEAFMQLPAETRFRFGNDPQRLMEFLAKKENLDEARKLGLAVPAPPIPEEPKPAKVIIVENPDGGNPKK